MYRSILWLISLLLLSRLGHSAPQWTRHQQRGSQDGQIQFKLHLQYQNIDQLEALLAGVSTPGSPTYGKYLSQSEISAIFGPSDNSQRQVSNWLGSIGAQNVKIDDSLVTFTLSPTAAANLFPGSGSPLPKSTSLSWPVPAALSQYVDVITTATNPADVTSLGRQNLNKSMRTSTRAHVHSRQVSLSCETTVIDVLDGGITVPAYTPQCVKELYGFGDYAADPTSGSTIAFANFLNETTNYADLALYESTYGIPSQNYTVLGLINGAVNDQNPATEIDPEGNLDAQTIIGLVDGLPVGAYLTAGVAPFIPDLFEPTMSANEPYLDFYTYLLSQSDDELPWVISQSYFDHENTVPIDYAHRVCNQIGLLGLRGRTILTASGDEGVGAICLQNQAPYLPQFSPTFPATCPYITSVGGTIQNSTSSSTSTTSAWIASSGGFSFYFSRAWYQTAAVTTYLTSYLPSSTANYYTRNNYTTLTGRAFPDLSAHAASPETAFIYAQTPVGGRGTSVSTPIVASLIALLNDARLRRGCPPMGFLNPWLYGGAGVDLLAEAFAAFGDDLLEENGAAMLRDVVTGGSRGCDGVDLQFGFPVPGGGMIPYASWNATPGWDPVTGLGVPVWKGLLASALLACGVVV